MCSLCMPTHVTLGALATLLLLIVPLHALSTKPIFKETSRFTQITAKEGVFCRRHALDTIVSITATAITNTPHHASAANLPKSTGANLSKTGTIDSLIPIVIFDKALIRTRLELNNLSQTEVVSPSKARSISNNLAKHIPRDETQFKRIFDEYSDPVSYKQKFIDQNAFLVYYTKGYDGPNRPSLESNIPESRQTLQYGARNDAWKALDDLFAELEFASKEGGEIGDIIAPMDKVIDAVQSYLSLAPVADLREARRHINSS